MKDDIGEGARQHYEQGIEVVGLTGGHEHEAAQESAEQELHRNLGALYVAEVGASELAPLGRHVPALSVGLARYFASGGRSASRVAERRE